MTEFSALKKLSARVGADPLLVQAAGGNTSLKHEGVMWIKASGTWLRDAASRDIFVPINREALLTALAKNDPACESCTDFVLANLNATGLRPSIETTVHALMPQRAVVHVHCVNSIAWAIRSDAEQRLAGKLKDFNWAFIPYARPGLPLANAIAARLKPGINVLILGNHGLVAAAETVFDAETLLDRVVKALVKPVRAAVLPDLTALRLLCTAKSVRRKRYFRGHQACFPRFTAHIAHMEQRVTAHARYSSIPPHFSIGKAVYARE